MTACGIRDFLINFFGQYELSCQKICPKFVPVNWTSTSTPLWQIDCENFRKVGKPFELRNVVTLQHRQFIEAFAERYYLDVEHGDGFARFVQRALKPNGSFNGHGSAHSAPNPNRRLKALPLD